MDEALAFDRLVHSDWSKSGSKRWTAIAHKTENEWKVVSLTPTRSSEDFVADLLSPIFKTLAGFDFAIGLPRQYLRDFDIGFRQFLRLLSDARFSNFFDPATVRGSISHHQPFYPKNALHQPRRIHLSEALRCSWEALFRECEKPTDHRGAASPIFWTLGAKQVGRAALSGWAEIIIPTLESARLWPYDGPLSDLALNGLTIAETYPAEAYHHVGLETRVSKRSQERRKQAAVSIQNFARAASIALPPAIELRLSEGFGISPDGEDPFDALVGLISMISVATGRRKAAPSDNLQVQSQEGWILGQLDLPRKQV